MEIPNLAYINSIADGDENFKQDLLLSLKEEFLKEKKAFLANFNHGDYLLASENVHKLKHKIAMLGLEEALSVASEFENNLKENNTGLHKKFINCLNLITDFLNQIKLA